MGYSLERVPVSSSGKPMEGAKSEWLLVDEGSGNCLIGSLRAVLVALADDLDEAGDEEFCALCAVRRTE